MAVLTEVGQIWTSLTDETSERVNEFVLKMHETVLLGQKYVQKVKYGLLSD